MRFFLIRFSFYVMKKTFLLPLLAVALMGAGCASMQPAEPASPSDTPISTAPTTTLPGAPTSTTPTTTLPTTPTTTMPMPTATSTLPVVARADWTSLNVFDNWTIQYPATAAQLSLTSAQKTEGKLFRIDLGTAVQNPAGRSVPKRTLEISKLRASDFRARGCDPGLVGEQNISSVQTANTAAGTAFCLQSSSDAGAGNLYDVQDYIFTTDSGTYAFTFVTHSVQCANFPDPAVQCVSFDAARDTGLSREIMGSVVKKQS